MKPGVGGDLLDGLHHALGGIELAQVFQQHHDRPESTDRIGQPLAHDVEGRAVNGLGTRLGLLGRTLHRVHAVQPRAAGMG